MWRYLWYHSPFYGNSKYLGTQRKVNRVDLATEIGIAATAAAFMLFFWT